MARSRGSKIELTAYDDLFETDESRAEANLSKIREIPIAEIDEFPDHPFKVLMDEDMEQLVDSVRRSGVMTPATVRQKEDGRYELISGHRRKKACELTFDDTEEKAVEKAIAALADMIPLEAIQPPQSPALVFPGLEIRLHQRRVLKDGADIYLTRLEYGALCYLAASPGRVFTKAQIFESVWSMESESCQSSVASVICNLRKKIEPDSKNPTYIKTVLGIGYKFASGE